MICLGLDPGTVTGYCVLRDGRLIEAGTLHAGTGTNRLPPLHDQLIDVLNAHPVSLAAVERVQFHPSKPGACVPLAEMRGVLLLALQRRSVATVEYTANEWKNSITGYGKASKSQAQRMIAGLVKADFTGQRLDVSDAAAIAYVAWLRHRHEAAA